MTHHEVYDIYEVYAKNEIVGKDKVCEHWKHKGCFQSCIYSCQFKDNFDPFVEIVHSPQKMCVSLNQPGAHGLSTLEAYLKKYSRKRFLLLIP